MARLPTLAFLLLLGSGINWAVQNADRAPQDYDYTLVRLPESYAATQIYLERANFRGDLVGRYMVGTLAGQKLWRGFVRRNGSFERIQIDGAVSTIPHSISDDGTIVGRYLDDKGEHGFIYSASHTVTRIDAEGATGTRLYDIAGSGIVSGSFKTTGKWQPALWTGGKFTALPAVPAALAADMAEAFGVNQHGHVVGHFTRASEAAAATGGHQKMYGFFYKDGVVSTTFDYPGSGWMSCAFDVSASGEVVGHYVDNVDGGVTGFVWKDGRFVARLRVPGARETYPQTILANGMLLGSAILSDEESVGFTAVPLRAKRN